MFPATLE
jgi:hypothetical protein